MIEPLESRIAPAAILTFTDGAGDAVTVKASKGTNTQLSTAVVRSGGDITAINLPNTIYEGSNFSISVSIPHGGHGHGTIAVPSINASGTDLGTVSIDGDVGGGIIGSNTSGTPAVKSFTAVSIGESNSSLNTLELNGVVPAFALKGDLAPLGALRFQGTAASGNLLGKATIDGGILGGGTVGGGFLLVEGSAGSIIVKGEMIGGTVNLTGVIDIVGSTTPTKVSVGDLIGSIGEFSGAIRAEGPLGAVSVARNVTGGTGLLSGSIVSEGNITSVSIGGTIVGNLANVSEIGAGASVFTGVLSSSGSLGKVTIGGSAGIGGLYEIESDGNISSVAIGGDANGLTVESGGNTGSVTIGGDMFASLISAHGTGTGLALGSATIRGSVQTGFVTAGEVVVSTQTVDENATMGTVTVGHEANVMIIEGGTVAGITSEIHSVSIGGPAISVEVASNFINKITVGGLLAPLTAGANNDNSTFAGVSFDEI
jgi:hypothetical protein